MTPPPRVDPHIGRLLQSRYRVVSRVAAGAMGTVYRGERVGLGRPVAIKFLMLGAAPASELRRRFAIEARAASRMSHPNCVPVIDFGAEGDTPYLVMEFVAGQSLRALMASGPLTVPRALRIARQILAGLAHAHAHGIVHRDIKPENILVWSDAMGEQVQIADFGLAKVDAPGVSQEVAVGTPSYMSPEQTLGLPVDARSDVYAAGVLLFELLTLQKPFSGRSPFETMQLQREAPIPAFEDVAPDRLVPRGIEGVVRRALAKDRDQRYGSAVDLAMALEWAVATARDDSEDLDVDALLAEAAPRSRWWHRIGVLAVLATVAVATWLAV